MSQGWIKLHRELTDKAIWKESTPEQKTILITLLMMANHKENEWEWKGERFKAEPGQFVTSLPSIVEKCGKGITTQNVRTALKRFEKYEFLTDESTNRNRLITIVNWGVYQGLESEDNNQTNRQLTGNQQATNRQLTANKNVRMKEGKKHSRKYIYDDTHYSMAEDFYNMILRNNPGQKKPNFESWANEIRLMMDKDNRNEEQIRYLMNWVQQDDFEMSNVMSPSKLRKRFDQLILKVKSERKRNKPTPEQNVEPLFQSDNVEITEDELL